MGGMAAGALWRMIWRASGGQVRSGLMQTLPAKMLGVRFPRLGAHITPEYGVVVEDKR